jgi:hypothetical protein
MDAPWGVRAFERQYREWLTSRRLRHNGGFDMEDENNWLVGVD